MSYYYENWLNFADFLRGHQGPLVVPHPHLRFSDLGVLKSFTES